MSFVISFTSSERADSLFKRAYKASLPFLPIFSPSNSYFLPSLLDRALSSPASSLTSAKNASSSLLLSILSLGFESILFNICSNTGFNFLSISLRSSSFLIPLLILLKSISPYCPFFPNDKFSDILRPF